MQVLASVLVPPLMRDLTGGKARVAAPGATVDQVLRALESTYPGFRGRLCQGDQINPYLGVAVDGVVTDLRLLQPVGDESEIEFLPALQGG
ncbi:MAG: MoaD/ThiS family protein [Chloroflexi bacterium]|nr:MoaD/ThiS family protein [Chloroflexota bacterium]